jgi:hypothetical protein
MACAFGRGNRLEGLRTWYGRTADFEEPRKPGPVHSCHWRKAFVPLPLLAVPDRMFLAGKGRDAMRTSYVSWIGRAVILQVAVGGHKVPVRGILVAESNDAVRLRIGESWEVDIFKAMIAAVDADGKAQMVN